MAYINVLNNLLTINLITFIGAPCPTEKHSRSGGGPRCSVKEKNQIVYFNRNTPVGYIVSHKTTVQLRCYSAGNPSMDQKSPGNNPETISKLHLYKMLNASEIQSPL